MSASLITVPPQTKSTPGMPPDKRTPARRPGKKLSRSEKIFIAVVMGPAFLHFLVFTAVPLLFSFALSFTEWQMLTVPKLVGLSNYAELFGDPLFRTAIWNTFLFTLFYVPPMLVLPLGLAILVNRPTKAATFFKTVYFLPVVTSFVVLAMIFEWVFQAEPSSLSNMAVRSTGLPAQAWLQDSQQALPLLALLGILKGAAWNMIYFLAGLQAVPDVFYEAAKVDGASRWLTFRRITLPLLRPTTYFVCVLTTIGAFQVFDAAYLLTQGGPGDATTTIVYYIYVAGFESFRMGYASASAFVLLALVLAVTMIQKRWLGRPADWY